MTSPETRGTGEVARYGRMLSRSAFLGARRRPAGTARFLQAGHGSGLRAPGVVVFAADIARVLQSREGSGIRPIGA